MFPNLLLTVTTLYVFLRGNYCVTGDRGEKIKSQRWDFVSKRVQFLPMTRIIIQVMFCHTKKMAVDAIKAMTNG